MDIETSFLTSGKKTVLPHCAGVIILRVNNKVIETVIVESLKHHYSFPKGKREKGETIYINAMRELKEETGLTLENITLIEKITYTEQNKKGDPNIVYYVAVIKEKYKDFKFTFPKDELCGVKWIPLEEASKSDKFKPKRIIILNNLMINKECTIDIIEKLSNK